jgi:hypothetical protein
MNKEDFLEHIEGAMTCIKMDYIVFSMNRTEEYNKGVSDTIKKVNEAINAYENEKKMQDKEVKVCPFLTGDGVLTYCTNGVISTDKTVLSCCKCSAWVEEKTSWAYGTKYVIIPRHCKRMKL